MLNEKACHNIKMLEVEFRVEGEPETKASVKEQEVVFAEAVHCKWREWGFGAVLRWSYSFMDVLLKDQSMKEQ